MKESAQIHLPKLISEEFEISTSEARRLLGQGAVRIDGTTHFGQCVPGDSLTGKTLTVGKRRSVKL